MKTRIILTSIFAVLSATLFAQTITQEQADAIVQQYANSEVPQSTALYANIAAPSEEGVAITTSNEESFTAKYACWAYCIEEPALRRYIFVNKMGGSILEVVANNDISPLEAESWEAMDMTGLANSKANPKQLYPNPVGDILILPCTANSRVEIYDLKGTRLFSGMLSGEGNCQLNVSFLNTGVYMVNVSGETFRIIKK